MGRAAKKRVLVVPDGMIADVEGKWLRKAVEAGLVSRDKALAASKRKEPDLEKWLDHPAEDALAFGELLRGDEEFHDDFPLNRLGYGLSAGGHMGQLVVNAASPWRGLAGPGLKAWFHKKFGGRLDEAGPGVGVADLLFEGGLAAKADVLVCADPEICLRAALDSVAYREDGGFEIVCSKAFWTDDHERRMRRLVLYSHGRLVAGVCDPFASTPM